MTITVQAIYRDGVLRPQKQLDLPDNAPVQVQITPLTPQGNAAGSLFGAMPQLSALTLEDLAVVQQVWESGLEKQAELIRQRK